MPTDWQLVKLAFAAGVDSGSDPKTIPSTKLSRLENGIFDKRGRISKRRGYTKLSDSVSAGILSRIDRARTLATRGDELVLLADSKIYSYIAGRDYWMERGIMPPVVQAQRTVAKAAAEQTHADRATLNGTTVYAWEDSRGGVRMQVVDEATGAVLREQLLGNARSMPRVVAVGNFLHVYCRDSGLATLTLDVVAAADPTFVYSPILLFADLRSATVPVFDVAVVGSTAFVVYATTTANTVKLARVREAGTVSGSVTSYSTTSEAVAIGIAVAPNGYPVIAYGNATLYEIAVFDDGLVFYAASGGMTANVCTRIAVEVSPTLVAGDYVAQIFAEVAGASAPVNFVEITTSTLGGTTGGLITYRRSCLASRAFVDGDQVFAHITHDSPLQATYFTVRQDGLLVAKTLAGVAGGRPVKAHLPTVQALGDRRYAWAGIYKTRLDVSNLSPLVNHPVYTEKGIKDITLDFDVAGPRGVEKDGVLYFTGGYLWEYDGQSPIESSFHLFPEGATGVGNTAGASSFLATEVRSYRAYYEWTNAAGKLCRSTCATAFNITTVANTNKHTITAPSLSHTLRTAVGLGAGLPLRSEVRIAFYRTQANPSDTASFHRVSSLNPTAVGDNGYVANNRAADTVTFVDSMSDAVLITQELDYQNTGELVNLAPDAPSILAETANRLWLAGFEGGRRVVYSKLPKEGESVSFNGRLALDVGEEGGDVTAISEMDGNVVVFKRDRIYGVAGDGPDNFGQDDFAPARLVTGDTGCTDLRSIVQTPEGILFKSAKGWKLLSRSFQVMPIGKDVEGQDAQDVTSAVLVADANHVRITTSSGLALVFDYFLGLWSTFTQHAGVAACIWRGTYTYARADGDVLVESATEYKDAGAVYKLLIETAWLHITPLLQGFQRVKSLHLIGTWRSAHKLRWAVAYDYEETFEPSVDFDPATVLNLTTWGSDVSWGASTPWGGGGDTVYQFAGFMRRQKCQAIKFRFEDVSSNPQGEAYQISELALLCGAEKGPARLRTGKKSGPGGVAPLGGAGGGS